MRVLPGVGRLAAPYLFGTVVLVLVPVVATFAIAFTDWSGFGSPRTVGFGNFADLFADERFRGAVVASLLFSAVAVPLRLLAVTALSLLLSRPTRLASAGSAAVLVPTVMPEAAFALVWLWILNPASGPLVRAAGSFGAEQLSPLTSGRSALLTLALLHVLQLGEGFVIALAARRALPDSVFDAASVSGASPAYVTRRVTIPLMAPVLWLLFIRDIALSLMASFGLALLVTQGGPAGATETLPLLAYREGFRYLRLGHAAAIGVVMLVLGLALAATAAFAAKVRLSRRLA